jgi:Tfp pilus assembly protein PilF
MTKQERQTVVRTIKQAAGYVERGDDAAALALLREALRWSC